MGESANINIYLKIFDQESSKLIKAAEKIENAFRGVEDAAKQLSDASKRAQQQLDNSGDAMEDAADKANVLRRALDSAKSMISNAATGLKTLHTRLTNARDEMKKMGSRVEALGGRMNVLGQRITFFIGLPLGLFLKDVVESAAEFDQQMIAVSKTTGLSSDATDMLSESIRLLSLNVPVARDELSDIAEVAGRAGIIAEKVTKINQAYADGNVELAKSLERDAVGALTSYIESISMATVALDEFGGNSELVTERLNQIGAIYDLPIEQTDNFASAMNELSNTTNTNANKITESLTRFSNARLFDIPIQDATAFASRLTELGVIPSRAGTELNSALSFMSKNLESAASIAGQTGEEFQKALQEDATNAIISVLEGLNKIEDNAGRNRAAVSVFGEVGSKAMNFLSGNVDALKDRLDLSRKAFEDGTSIIDEYNRATEGLVMQFQQFKNILDELKMIVFDALEGALSPALKTATELVTAFVEQLRNMDEGTRNRIILIASAITSVVVAAGPLLLLVGLLVTAIGSMTTAIATLAGPTGFGLLLGGGVLLFSLFGELFSAVDILDEGFKGVLATGILLANSFGLLSDKSTIDFMEKLGIVTGESSVKLNEAKQKVDEWRDKIIAAKDRVIEFKNKIVDFAVNVLDWWRKINEENKIWDRLTSLFDLVVDVIVDRLWPAMKRLIDVVIENKEELALLAKGIVGGLFTAITFAIELFGFFAETVIDVISRVVGVVSGFLEIFQGVVDMIYGIVTGDWQLAWDGFTEIVKGAWKVFKNTIGLIVDIVGNAVTSIIDWFAYLYDVLVGHSIVPDLIDDMVDFFWQLPERALDAVSSFVTQTLDSMRNLASESFDIGKNMVQGFIDGLWNKSGNLWDAVKSVANNAVSTAEDTLGIHSPSRVFAQIGEYSALGFVEGLKRVEGMTSGVDMIPKNIGSISQPQYASGQSISRSAESVKQEVHIHYEYSPKVGAMIASKGEQRDFMREIRKLMAEENQRYGIDPNLAYDTGIVTQQ